MFTRLSAPMLAAASATRNLSPWRLPRVPGLALAADNLPRTPWPWSASFWELPRWDFRAFPPPMLPKRRRAAAPANWSSIFFAATSPPRKSLPRRPGYRFPSTILTALVRAFPFLQISNREDDLLQLISTQRAAPRSLQSASLKLDCFAATPSPSPDALSPRKPPVPKKRRRRKLSANSTLPSSRPAALSS